MKAEVPLREKLSLFWLARHKPYSLVLLSGILLGASFPPSPFFFLSFFALVPLFILVEAVPERVPEDKVFLPFKKIVLPIWWLVWLPVRLVFRLGEYKKIRVEWEAEGKPKGWTERPFARFMGYHRHTISGNAQLFRYTYATFLLWNILGTYWLCLTALGAKSGAEFFVNFVAGLLAIVLNPALMTIPFQMYARLRRQISPVLAAALGGVLWITFEFAHFNWEAAWPWLTLGHALSGTPSMIQYAEFTGVLGISLHIWVANVLVYWVWHGLHHKKGRYWIRGTSAAVWILFPLLLNPILTRQGREVFQPSGELTVRIIQPNIDPYEVKFDGTTYFDQVDLFAEMAVDTGLAGVDLILLPETAVPRAVRHAQINSDALLRPLWKVTKENPVTLVTGFVETREFVEGQQEIPPSAVRFRKEIHLGDTTGPDTLQIYADNCNAALALHDSLNFATYQKSKLVPMVERIPWLDAFSFLRAFNIDLGGGFGSFGMPDSLQLLPVNDSTKLGVMICYESVFGGFVRKESEAGAELLCIITNDGWWGKTSGYVQHAQISRLRAIENRRSVIRSANTGTSLFADPTGKFSQETPFNEPAIIQQKVTLHKNKTFYVRNGDYLGWIALFGSIVLIIFRTTTDRLRKSAEESASEPEE